MVTAVTFYGMATFEGPLLSIKSVSSLGHYTDWIIAHVHGGALGWNGFLTFAMIYYLVPRLWDTKLYSVRLATVHFWLGFTGIILYYLSMVSAGITQGLMWRAIDAQGRLMYPDFMETVTRIVPLYWARAAGGAFFIAGFLVMVYNIWKTIKMAKGVAENPVLKAPKISLEASGKKEDFHRRLEGMTALFTVLTIIAVLVGSIIEIYPTLSLHRYLPEKISTKPYTALELAGRDVYVKEGCYVCHSQQIRPIASEVLRFGKASTVEESMYDRPFQWGSKRTGPDLARVGKKYPDMWHFQHMMNPRSITPQSIMPNYFWLADNKVDFLLLRKKLSVMRSLGVPYSEEEVVNADIMAEKQAKGIAEGLQGQGAPAGLEKKEIVALIAYLQSLGQKTEGVGK
jgi:cytochrome c oxidase cbb3-type subunit I/II